MKRYIVVRDDGAWSGSFRHRETAEQIAEVWRKNEPLKVEVKEIEVERW